MVDWSRIRVSRTDDTGAALKGWWPRRWQAWRDARARRDVLGAYRADYGEAARFRWWSRLRAGVGLLLVVIVVGAGLTTLVGLLFIGFTIALETLV